MDFAVEDLRDVQPKSEQTHTRPSGFLKSMAVKVMNQRRDAIQSTDKVFPVDENAFNSSSVSNSSQNGHKLSLKQVADNAMNNKEKLLEQEQSIKNKTLLAKIFTIAIFVTALIIFIIWFSISYDDFAVANPSKNKAVDGIYYWGTVTSTVGFGDICPKTNSAKLFTTAYQVCLLAISMGAVMFFANNKLKLLNISNIRALDSQRRKTVVEKGSSEDSSPSQTKDSEDSSARGPDVFLT